jgi:hypothetical protein
MKRQRGQGLLESIFAFAALLACACAIAWIGSAQHQAMQAAQASRAAAFAAARGDAPASRDGIRLGSSRDQAGPAPADGRQAQLQRDWLRVDTHLVRVEAQRRIQPPGGWSWLSVGDVSVRRHTAVAQAGGHAVSDQAGQQRIMESRMGWQEAAEPSQSLARRLRSSIAGIDGAWGGRKPDLDWVSAWSGLVPSDKLANGGRP